VIASRWRWLHDDTAAFGIADGATNMAVDAALLDHARRTGEATLRMYAWARPTLSFGRHERTRGLFDAAHLAARGVDAVRRPTGGRALLHHREVTYSVTAPVAGATLGESYRAINAFLCDALARLGVHAAEAPRATGRAGALRPEGAACFAEPSTGELTVGGAKLVGSAQLREQGAFLQHGSILLEDDQSSIAALRLDAAEGTALPPAPVATLRSATGRAVAPREVQDALLASLGDACARAGVTSPSPLESDSGIVAAVAEHRARFADPAWIWRR
jgi:lipoate-protein ligase A